MTVALNPQTPQLNNKNSLEPDKYRASLLNTLSIILSAISISAGSLILVTYLFQSIRVLEAFFIGIGCLSFGLICAAIYFTSDWVSYQIGSGVMTSCLLLFGGYLLFSPWILSGILLLLMAVLISVILFTFQISILVFMVAQTFVVAIMTMLNFELLAVPNSSDSWLVLLFQTGAVMVIFYLLAVIILNSASSAIHRQAELKEQLDLEKQMLKRKVEEHTRTLNITGEVNRLISTILDSNRLVGDVVEQIRQAFNYYHVQIYLLQPEENVLKIAGATGEAGTALLIGQHQIPMDTGLVGQAASTVSPVVVANVAESTDWVPNSLLPDTVAEIAVPIIWENKVLGVLDVQHDKPFDLSENGINILQTIAIQLGTAISNVNIFQEAEEQLKRESIINDMSLKLQVAPDIQSSMQLVGKNIAQVLEPISIKVEIDPALLKLEKEQEA